MTDVSNMTGADQFKRPPELKLNQIRYNGKEGKFQLIDVLSKQEDQKAEIKDLGNELKVVFLKVRRQLGYWDEGNKRFVQTNEHNHKDDIVYLFGENKRGKASDLREQNEKLKTIQIVYCMTEGHGIVRLSLKGSQLGSQSQSKDRTAFYEYLQGFNADESVHEFSTLMKGVTEKGKLGEYWTLHYAKGDRLNPETITKAEEEIVKIHEWSTKVDEHYAKQTQEKSDSRVQADKDFDEIGTETKDIEYPAEEIDPKDIPF